MYALFVELEGHFELTVHLVLFSDLLVHADQVFENLNLDSVEISFGCLGEGSLKLTHGFELVVNVFFTETEAFVSQCFALKIFEVE